MKTINKIIMAILLMASFASCSNKKEPKVVSTEEYESILGKQTIKATFDDGMVMNFQVKSPSEVALFSKEEIPASGCVTIPSTIVSNGNTYQVVEIGSLAFQGCDNMTSVTIPNSVTSIGNNAFVDCRGLTSVTIPKEVTSAGFGIFNYCTGLTSVIIENGVTEIWESTFSGCTGLTSVSIPDGVTSIGKGAFVGCTGLTSISIPNSVTSIGERAFADCTNLTSITIPNGVTDIGSEAFSGCSGLTSITLPNSVTEIGDQAFFSCKSLTNVTIQTQNLSFAYDDMFAYCDNLQPNNVVYQTEDGTRLITINDIAGVYFGGEFGGMYLWNDGTWAGGYNNLTYGGTWMVLNNEVKLEYDFDQYEPVTYDDAIAETKSEILPIDLTHQKLGPWTKQPFITEQEIADARKEFETGDYGDNWEDYVDMTFYGYDIVHRMTKEDFKKKKYR